MTDWAAPVARKSINAAITLPGSKSLSNRELILCALADSPSTLSGVLEARDTVLMIEGLRSLGVDIEEVGGDRAGNLNLKITPHFLRAGVDSPTVINVGLAGTVMRFLPAVAAFAHGDSYFDGDAAARKRPMATLLEALKDLGVEVEDRGRLPFVIRGNGHVRGGEVVLDASKSSQFVSALLLSSARCDAGATIRHVPADLGNVRAVPSLPHVEMTINTLALHGVTVRRGTDSQDSWHVDPQNINGVNLTIEGDLSNATPFFAAALVAGGTVACPDWPKNSMQPVSRIVEVFERLGADITRDGDIFQLRGSGEIQGIDVDLGDIGEVAPTIAALCALAQTPSYLRGIGHLRGHETDRLSALAAQINALGGKVVEEPTALRIIPAPLHGGTFLTFEDHRMATAGAILGLRVVGVTVENIETTGKTLPNFQHRWEELLNT
jgi:3-phosphoshikimate 1-carboxyvinyltransferase